jgi:hypothetical protein
MPQAGRPEQLTCVYPLRMGIEVLPATGRWDDFASFMVPRKPGGGVSYRNSSLGMPGRIEL